MSIDEDNHASSHSKNNKMRESMDMEFHDHIESYTEPLTEDADESSSHLPVHDESDSFDDSDDDSFCAASDDCEPDHKFLAEILEDEHPERLNLLETNVPAPKNCSGPNIAPKPESAPKLEDKLEKTVEESGEMDVDEDKKEPEKPESVKVAQEPENGINVDKGNPEEEEAEEETDTFPAPTSTPEISRPQLRKGGLGDMGKSTKKSFRGVSSTFFSRPFKGLARSFRRPGNK
jgi:hypothetical protein